MGFRGEFTVPPRGSNEGWRPKTKGWHLRKAYCTYKKCGWSGRFYEAHTGGNAVECPLCASVVSNKNFQAWNNYNKSLDSDAKKTAQVIAAFGRQTMNNITEVREAREAIMCLRLEVDESIVNDISKKVEAAFKALASQQSVEVDAETPPCAICGCVGYHLPSCVRLTSGCTA